MRLAAGIRPDPLRSLSARLDPLAAIGGWVPTSKAERREGNRKREGRGNGGRKGKDDLHPTLFLGPASISRKKSSV